MSISLFDSFDILFCDAAGATSEQFPKPISNVYAIRANKTAR